MRDEGWVLKKYTIAAIGLDAEEYDLTKVDENKFIYLEFFPNTLLDAEKERNKILEFVKQKADAVIFKERALKVEREKFYQQLKDETGAIPIIPIGTEVIEAGIYNIELTSVQEINRYFFYGGLKNITNALLYIAANVLGIDDLPSAEKPEPVAFEGIFHPDSETVFSSWDDYSNWYQGRSNYGSGQWVGLLTHRSNWVTNNLEVETALIRELEKLGIRVVPVFSYGTAEPELNTKDFDGIVDAYFSSDDHRLVIDALINLQVFILRSDTSGQNIFEQVVSKMKQLDIPVFKPIVSFGSKERWEESQQGLMLEIPWSFTVPEVQGMIEPLIIGYRDKEGKACFLPDRVIKFTRRVEKWLALRRTQNKDKRLAIFLHNAPCSGVEATIGMGAGLDVFTTVVNIINELKKSGWVVENIPAEGSELHQLIMERKAFADFRWTSVEEVVDSGGCLYQMPLDVYYPFYEQLDPQCQEDLEKTWGPPPGEGMVYQKHLIITGINFGNVSVLVQPKRGCYGAKCTGEVCKMLQDTHCPPPHQYLATYRYVEEVFKAHAVLHVGTHGNLEFLPGKSNALSRRCYPDLVLGALPNFYVYNAGVGTEGILAKRRTNAVIVDHLPPIYGVQNTGVLQLVNLIDNYLEAVNFKSDQVHALEALVREQLPQIPGAQTVVDRSETFFNGLIELKNSLVQSVCNPKCEKLHVFGSEKTEEEILWYIKEVVQSDVKLMTRLRDRWQEDYDLHRFLIEFIMQVISNQEQDALSIIQEIDRHVLDVELKEILIDLAVEVREVYSKLAMTPVEMDNLLHALNGGYILPGPSGMPDDNGKNIIPTGRNLYLMDIEKVPTKAAWEVGCQAAEELIDLYMTEECHYPEKIAMNMLSLDISRTKGEQLSQVLYLMGIKPVWDGNGKVIGLEVISLEKLNRPRIDVTIRITGVLRDSYPQAVELIDSAVNMAAGLSEPNDLNFIKKHTCQLAEVLKDAGKGSELRRRSTMRIFGDRPGTYGTGVDLALKASAWKDETDLAKIFVYFSSYAYGKSLHGNPAKREFVENVKNAQIAYDVSNSKRYDILSSGFGASVQGGFGLIRKVFNGKELKQYHGSRENPEQVKISRLEDTLQETLDEKLLNPLWIESVQEKGYHGAAELMERLQNVFDWQCLTQGFEDTALDRLVDEYVNDPEMRKWFIENNLFAIEEIARRFLELYQREKWQADPDVLEELKGNYLELEGELEERLGDVKGEIQAGNIDVIGDADVKEWQDKLQEVSDLFDELQKQ
ncbi:Aerobic cobaltochelatase subunit CobN3 [Syntrophaceticus schinkii]|uniref:Aerobic cobaltochelatase subunit CobN3 n=1 Tax=Syntrophaceticus schinkii TaxID=499207 RepID=A0A0B7MFB1_9FIRM|nr:Aerobic cobaltochelatase subunit CobN3 [Syntrophaceticus schinkii]